VYSVVVDCFVVQMLRQGVRHGQLFDGVVKNLKKKRSFVRLFLGIFSVFRNPTHCKYVWLTWTLTYSGSNPQFIFQTSWSYGSVPQRIPLFLTWHPVVHRWLYHRVGLS
jgi:hypothetical protein